MNVTDALTRTGLFLKDNSPLILTAFGVAGVGSTAYLTHKAAEKSYGQILRRSLHHKDEEWDPTKREIFELTWRNYIPPVLMGIATVSCVIGAQTVNSRRQAALIGAYTFAERSLNEFREKTEEVVGEKKAAEIHEKIVEDRILEDPRPEGIILAGNEYLCYDVLTGRYFKCDIETIRRAQNDINEQVFNDMYASLNDFYSKIGLPTLPMGETMGWNTDNKLEIRYTYVPDSEGRPTLALEFRNQPTMEYYKSVW